MSNTGCTGWYYCKNNSYLFFHKYILCVFVVFVLCVGKFHKYKYTPTES